MERTNINKLKEYIGQKVKIQGWIHTIRDQKRMQFLVVRDRSGMAQVVLEKEQNQKAAEIISSLSTECCVTIIGNVIENPHVKMGGFEVAIEEIKVDSYVAAQLPFDVSAQDRPGLDKRLDWRFLDLRREENLLIFKVQTIVEMAMREF